jgi:hypothetical protein
MALLVTFKPGFVGLYSQPLVFQVVSWAMQVVQVADSWLGLVWSCLATEDNIFPCAPVKNWHFAFFT